MEGRAPIGDTELAFGIEGTGPRLVWFHGLASCREGDADIIDALAQRFEVLSYDARGHGRSAPVYETERYSYEILASDALALLDHVGWDRAVLAGASMGAATAGRLAAISDRARALVLTRPAAGDDDGTAPVWLQLLFAGGAHAIRTGGLDAAISFLLTIPAAREELERRPERLEALRADWMRHDPLSIAAALEAIPRSSALAGGVSPDRISCPVVVIPGDDLIHPTEAGERLAGMIAGARLAEPFDGVTRDVEVARLVALIGSLVTG